MLDAYQNHTQHNCAHRVLSRQEYHSLFEKINLARTLDLAPCECENSQGASAIALEAKKARAIIWEHNHCLVMQVLKTIKFRSNTVETMDLVQSGEVGLELAIEKYNVNFDVQFQTFAYYSIRFNMLKDIGLMAQMRLSGGTNDLMCKLIKLDMGSLLFHVSTEEIYYVANNLNISYDVAKKLLLCYASPSSFDIEYCDTGSIKYSGNIQLDNLEQSELEEQFMKTVRLSNLSENMKLAILMRVGMVDGVIHKFSTLGKLAGCSGENVRLQARRVFFRMEEGMKVLALDPGETTGYVVFNQDKHEIVESGQFPYIQELERLIELCDFVIIEKFELFPHKAKEQIGSTFPTCEVIGVAKYLCGKFNRDYILQRPLDQSFFNDAKLKILGFRTNRKHANSAIKHLLHYYVNVKDKWILDKLAAIADVIE